MAFHHPIPDAMTALPRTVATLALLLATAGACRAAPTVPQTPAPPGAQAPPRLVVLLVVDQLPDHLLDDLEPAFSGGFRKILDRGFRHLNTTHDHAITETAPGHATISTGTEPARNGLVSNDWWERINGQMRLIFNVVDPSSPVVGHPTVPGASPGVLRRDGLADWLQDAHPDAKVVSVSGKDRGAVLLAAHSDAQVWWFEPVLGRFVTSVHYRDRVPAWIDAFNRDVLAPMAADSVWELTVPEDLRSLARPDSFPLEGDGVHTAFPHAFTDLVADSATLARSFWPWWAGTPALDDATLRLARAAAEAEDLGTDDVPDLLAVSLSQTDRVGHAYGPGSLEQLDNLLRLDGELGEFLDWLDARMGPDGYVLAFTSDHGAMDLPEARAARGEPGVRLTQDSVAPLQAVIDRVSAGSPGPEELARALVAQAPTVSWIDRAWLRSALQAGPPEPDSFTRLQLANFDPERMAGLLSRAGLEMQTAEGVLTWSYPTGTGHGSPWLYDRAVPLVFMGAGITPGTTDDRTSTADIAPTLADLMGIPWPKDLDGVSRRR